MKRSILAVLVAVLALATAFGATAAATPGGDSQATAAKKGKKKGCKKGKAKGKAKGSQATSSKGKKKGKGCKKGKGPSTGTPGEGKQPPSTPTPPPPSEPWPPSDGTYDGGALSVELSGGAKLAVITFDGGQGTCVALGLKTEQAPTILTPETLGAIGHQKVQVLDDGIEMNITLVVVKDLTFKATIDSKTTAAGKEICNKPGVIVSGTLKKVS